MERLLSVLAQVNTLKKRFENMNEILILLVIGALGGLLRSFLGYRNHAPMHEGFDYVKMARSMIRAAIAGCFIVYSTVSITNGTLGTAEYILAFFLSIGADTITKESYTAVKK
jgi:fluoride ion exporter CrcB/FEX